ncbi:MAG: MCE family protein [Bacteroidales bacterium]|nr:MCE family protein [Bacteroidales bacterium]
MFNKENTYFVRYEKIEGLEKSSPVYIRGFKIGQVDDITFTDNSHKYFTVEISLKSDIYITDSTVARIFSNDLMGNKAVEIILGNNRTLLKSGDTLLPQIEESLSEQVKLQMVPLKNEAEKLIKDLQNAAQSVAFVLNENTGMRLRDSFIKLQYAIESIHNASNSLDTILSGGKNDIANILFNLQSITGNIRKNNDDISGILNNFEKITDSISKSNLTHTLLTLDTVVGDVSKILKKIESGEGTIGQLINDDSLYNNINKVAADLDLLIKDINTNPKNYVQFSIFGGGKDEEKKEKKSKVYVK